MLGEGAVLLQRAFRTIIQSGTSIAPHPAQKSLFHSAALSLCVRIGGVGLSYAVNILLSRSLGLHAFGEYVIALSWALALTLPAKAGFDISALRYSTIYFEKRDFAALRGFLNFAFVIVIFLALLIAAVVAVVDPFQMPVSPATRMNSALLIPVLALLAVSSVVMRTTQRIVSSQFYEQILRPSLIIAGIGLAALLKVQLSPASAMAITAIAALIALAAILYQLERIFRSICVHGARYHEWRLWLAVSFPMLLLGVAQEMMNQIDIILLGQLSNEGQAALFAASWRLASLVPFALVALGTVSGPMIAAAYERKDLDEMHRLSTLVARGGLLFAILSAAVLYIFAGPLLSVFGQGFVAAKPVLSILLLGGVVNAFTGVVSYFALLTGREKQALMIFAGALVLSIVVNLLMIPRFGAEGAAVASSSATIAWNLMLLIYVRRRFGIDASALAARPRTS